ncbi:hypothetical protein ACIBG0_29440 [Nocardia sp. NPDC050630]|uniref:hypothetical protein n=1 Tax=Nocardia sp. NPDC050630 TaxID=3364321 RepID=UPI0037ADC48D
MMIIKVRKPEQRRYYTERVRPLMGPDDPEPREEPWEPPVAPVRHADALTGERTSRAMLPTPVA